MVDVLELLCQGLTNKEIGARLFISEMTVRDNLQRSYQRLGVEKRIPAAIAWTQRRDAYLATVDAMHATMCGTARCAACCVKDED